MKITIITACWNAIGTIRDAMASVAGQRLGSEKLELGIRNEGNSTTHNSSLKPLTSLELEYIVVDGGSTDGTVDAIKEFEKSHCRPQPSTSTFSFKWVSEKDKGLYDAINKGIKMATGDVVGICNADDVLADDDVVAKIAKCFESEKCELGIRNEGNSTIHNSSFKLHTSIDCVYADIRFVKREENPLSTSTFSLDLLRASPTTRYCTGKFFRPWMFRFATFPAHPSTFVRKECFEKYGYYSLDYKICADFEMMLRLFWKHGVRTKYLPICTHVMRTGGMSTNGLKSNVQINREDLRAIKANGYWSCLPLIYTKYLFKIWGFLRKK